MKQFTSLNLSLLNSCSPVHSRGAHLKNHLNDSELPQTKKFNCSSAWISTVLQLFNRDSIWWVPVCIKDFLKLWNKVRVVRSKAYPTCCVKVIPNKIACPNVSSHITNCILPMVYPGISRVNISCTSCLMSGRSRQIETWNLIVLDLNFSRTFVVLWRRAEHIGVEERLQVLISVVNKMSPVCHQYLHFCMLGEDDLLIHELSKTMKP